MLETAKNATVMRPASRFEADATPVVGSTSHKHCAATRGFLQVSILMNIYIWPAIKLFDLILWEKQTDWRMLVMKFWIYRTDW
jgi:hypothetical protein